MEHNQTHAKHLFTHKCQTLNILIFLLNLILVLFYMQLLSEVTAQVTVKADQKNRSKKRKGSGGVHTKVRAGILFSNLRYLNSPVRLKEDSIQENCLFLSISNK